MAIIEVEKSYHTREGNTVRIVGRQEDMDGQGVPHTVFTGSFIAARRGSEPMLEPPNHVARFTSVGRWLARPGHEQPDKSCHDLIEECHA